MRRRSLVAVLLAVWGTQESGFCRVQLPLLLPWVAVPVPRSMCGGPLPANPQPSEMLCMTPAGVAAGILLSTLHGRLRVILISPGGRHSYPHCTVEETETQRGSVPHPRSHSGRARGEIPALWLRSWNSDTRPVA